MKISYIIISIFFFSLFCNAEDNANLGISEKRAIKIARTAYRKKGGKPNSRNAYAGIARGDKNPYTSKKTKAMPKIKKKLADKVYWIVELQQKILMPGGIVVFFIDAQTGEVYGMYGEK